MGFFRKHFTKMPADVQREGLGRWFEIVEERFMDIFWVNIATLGCLVPSIVCFMIMVGMKDFRWWIPGLILAVCAGPAVTAMHTICMRIVLRMHYWLWEDYKGCIRKEWRSSALLTFILGVFWSVYSLAIYLVWEVEGRIPLFLFVIFAVYGYLLVGVTMFSYQILSVVRLPLRYILKDSVLLIFAGKIRSVASVFLIITGAVFIYCQTLWTGIFIIVGGFGLMTMTTCLINENVIKQCMK